MIPVERHDTRSISRVARTISLAFAHDPLIKWLRPQAQTWEGLNQEICKWQFRRIENATLDGYVFYTAPRKISDASTVLTAKIGTPTSTIERPRISTTTEEEEVPAVIILFPPPKHLKWTMQRIMLACKLWVLDLVDAAPDHGTSPRRLDRLLEAHEVGLEKARGKCSDKDLWYLEVLAVHPSFQGQGVGSKAMQWLLDFLGDRPVALECTAKSNISFYQKFGFEVIDEIELIDESSAEKEDDRTTCWLMLRKGNTPHIASSAVTCRLASK